MYSISKRYLLWTILLILSSLWHQQCGFSDWDLRASTLSCLLLKKTTARSKNVSFQNTVMDDNNKNINNIDDCNTINTYCISPSQIQILGPRILSDIIAIGGPAWIWLPLLYILYKGITTSYSIEYLSNNSPQVSNRSNSNNSSSSSSSSNVRNSVPNSSTTIPHHSSSTSESWLLLTIIFSILRIVIIYSMYIYLIFIMFIRFTVKLSIVSNTYLSWLSNWDPSGHVFLYGLQLIPLWLLPTLSTTTTSSSSLASNHYHTNNSILKHIYYHPTLSWLSTYCYPYIGTLSFQHILLFFEILIYYMTFTTSSFFHTPSETFMAWFIISLSISIIRYYVPIIVSEIRKSKLNPPSASLNIPILISTPTIQYIEQWFYPILVFYCITVLWSYFYIMIPLHHSSLSLSLLSSSITSYSMFISYCIYDILVIIGISMLRKHSKRI